MENGKWAKNGKLKMDNGNNFLSQFSILHLQSSPAHGVSEELRDGKLKFVLH